MRKLKGIKSPWFVNNYLGFKYWETENIGVLHLYIPRVERILVGNSITSINGLVNIYGEHDKYIVSIVKGLSSKKLSNSTMLQGKIWSGDCHYSKYLFIIKNQLIYTWAYVVLKNRRNK